MDAFCRDMFTLVLKAMIFMHHSGIFFEEFFIFFNFGISIKFFRCFFDCFSDFTYLVD